MTIIEKIITVDNINAIVSKLYDETRYNIVKEYNDLLDFSIESNVKSIQNFIDFLPDMIFLKNKRFQYVMVNKALLDFFQLQKDEVIGKTDLEVFGKHSQAIFRQLDKYVYNTLSTLSYKQSLIHDVYKYKIFNTTKSPIYNKNLDKVGIFGITNDITNDVMMNQVKNDTQEVLEELLKGKDASEILQKLSHSFESINPKSKVYFSIYKDKRLYKCVQNTSLLNLSHKQCMLSNIKSCVINGFKVGTQRVEYNNIQQNDLCFAFNVPENSDYKKVIIEPILNHEKVLLGHFYVFTNGSLHSSDENKMINQYTKFATIILENEEYRKELTLQKQLLSLQDKQESIYSKVDSSSHQ